MQIYGEFIYIYISVILDLLAAVRGCGRDVV